jgi:hypothetical protein
MMVVGGLIIPQIAIYAMLTYGIICLIQPWSLTFKSIGVMIGLGAYAMLPFAITGAL